MPDSDLHYGSAMLAPLLSQAVSADLTDYNGHLSDYAYAVLFSGASVVMLDRFGLGAEYRERTQCTIYTLEWNIQFIREMKQADVASITYLILDLDRKKFHVAFRLADGRGNLAAICEAVMVHVRQSAETGPKSFPLEDKIAERIAAIQEASRDAAQRLSPRLGLKSRRPAVTAP